jgi:competence protein ComEA
MSLLQSLLLKLGMLAVTLGVVFWIGWNAPLSVGSKPEAEPAVGEQADAPGGGAADPSSQQDEHVSILPHVIQPDRVGRETPQPPPAGPPQSGPLDLNRASAEELQALPGIGPVLAQRVVEYRSSAGGFRRVEDLRQVKGIGAKKYDRVRTLVSVTVPAVPSKKKHAL